MQKIRWFFLIVGIVLALALALQNNDLAEVHLLWLQQELPLSVLLLATTAIGFLVGSLTTALMLRRRKVQGTATAKPAKKPMSDSVPTPADQRAEQAPLK